MVFNLAGFAVMLPALGALWAFNKKGNARGKLQTVINWLKMGLAFVAGCGMAFTFLGSGLAAVIGWVSGLSPALKVGIPLALVLAAGLLALLDIAFDKQADKGAQIAAAITPTLLALVIAGAIGVSGGHAVHTTYNQMHAQFVKMGGHS
jgi:hypothetical protein